METKLQVPQKTVTASFTPVSGGLLRRKCACGGTPGILGECEECNRERLLPERARRNSESETRDAEGAPPMSDVMRSPQFLAAKRALMVPGLGHDFGRLSLYAPPQESGGTELTVGDPHDKYEQEADRVAEEVMTIPGTGESASAGVGIQAMPARQISRMPDESARGSEAADSETVLKVMKIICPDCPEEEGAVQAKAASGSGVTPHLESQIDTVKGGGEPLSQHVRAFFEPRFGYDFSHVRIHTDAAAAQTAEQLNALAYTVGSHVAFGPGQYAPSTAAGKRLLAHELTHVVQQNPEARRMPASGAFARTGGNNEISRSDDWLFTVGGISPTRISKQTNPNQIHLHTKADCDRDYETCCDGCRALPPNAKRRRALCWAACMTAYAACLASSTEALTFAAIVLAIVLICADGPFPIGDAAAAALLISLGITGS